MTDTHFEFLSSNQLEPVLQSVFRQYLAGNLQRPQELPFIQDKQLEVGITHYSESTSEAPHWHHLQREYQYMLSGLTTYIEIPSGRTFRFKQGDFYTIHPGACYAQDSEADTRILFIKRPALNDKVTCEFCPKELCHYRVHSFSGTAKDAPCVSKLELER